MIRLNEAWSVLSDPYRRRAYDRGLGLVADPGAAAATAPDEDHDVFASAEVPTFSGGAPRSSIIQALPVLSIAGGTVAGGLGFGAGMPGLLALGSMMFGLGGLGVAANVLLALRGDPRARERARVKQQEERTRRRRR